MRVMISDSRLPDMNDENDAKVAHLQKHKELQWFWSQLEYPGPGYSNWLSSQWVFTVFEVSAMVRVAHVRNIRNYNGFGGN